jgi:hypothetical protein
LQNTHGEFFKTHGVFSETHGVFYETRGVSAEAAKKRIYLPENLVVSIYCRIFVAENQKL